MITNYCFTRCRIDDATLICRRKTVLTKLVNSKIRRFASTPPTQSSVLNSRLQYFQLFVSNLPANTLSCCRNSSLNFSELPHLCTPALSESGAGIPKVACARPSWRLTALRISCFAPLITFNQCLLCVVYQQMIQLFNVPDVAR